MVLPSLSRAMAVRGGEAFLYRRRRVRATSRLQPHRIAEEGSGTAGFVVEGVQLAAT